MTLQEAISRLERSYFTMWVRQYEKGEADGFVGGNVSCNALAEVFLAAKKYAADQPAATIGTGRCQPTLTECPACRNNLAMCMAVRAADQQAACKRCNGTGILIRIGGSDGGNCPDCTPDQQSPTLCRHGVPEDACMACDMDKIVAPDPKSGGRR
jgi:hypothetical protein